MHNYKGQLRREQQDFTPTKSSWDKEFQQAQMQKYDNKYEKSEISYYQSQGSRVIYEYNPSEKPSARSHVQENQTGFN